MEEGRKELIPSKATKKDRNEQSSSQKRTLRKFKTKGQIQDRYFACSNRVSHNFVPVKHVFKEELNHPQDSLAKVASRNLQSGYKPSIVRTPCNSSDDLQMKKEDEDSMPGAHHTSLVSRSCSKQTLRTQPQWVRGRRMASSPKKAKSSNNKRSSRSAGSNDMKRKNPILKKIIETMKDKMGDHDVEQKIYSYLDFIDKHGACSPFFISKSQGDHFKTKKQKTPKVALEQHKSQETHNRSCSRKSMIDKKMIEFKKQLEDFTKAFKLQRDENLKLKKAIMEMVKDHTDGSSSTPYE